MFFVLHALPLVAVVIGLAMSRGSIRRVAPNSVLLVWCAISLASKQAVFVITAGLDWHAGPAAGILFSALVPVAAILLIPSARWQAVLAWLAVAAGTMLMTADHLYYAWFGDTLPAVALMALRQAGTLRGSISDLLSRSDAWSFLDLIVALPLVRAAWPRREAAAMPWRRVAMLEAVCVSALLATGATAFWRVADDPAQITQRFSNVSLVEDVGPFSFHVIDAVLSAKRSLMSRLSSEQTFEELVRWFEDRAPMRAGTGSWFGVAGGKNLIVIQVESLQAAMVDLRIEGEPVMPNLRALRADSISFSDVIDQTDEGRTSDAEWIMLTSQLPEPHGAAAFVDQGNHVVGLPSVLAAKGYDSLSAVAFAPSFWNRRIMHENFGFFRSYFDADFRGGDRVGWGLNDHDFLQQMSKRLGDAREPFAAWLITLSLHYPFAEFPDQLKTLKVGQWEGTSFGNYVHAMHFFDHALGDFIQSLKRRGLYDSSVLVVLGDHSAGLRWQPDVAHALGFANDMVHWTMAERVPLVIHAPGVAPLEVSRPIGQMDFAPTILGLLGVDAAPLPYIGRN